MTKQLFDRHLEAVYADLLLIAESRYQDKGGDALHDALLSIYRCEAYSKLHSDLSEKKVTGWIVQAVIFAMRSKWRDEGVYHKRYKLLSEFERVSITHEVRGLDIGAEEYPVDIVSDVQRAVGTLSAYHQGLVFAHYYEELTLRELAKRIGETFYRIFTEMEVVKALLRTELGEYRPRRCKLP
jgi:DNA-directed RNA polymerase specialized sigma24 family protein